MDDPTAHIPAERDPTAGIAADTDHTAHIPADVPRGTTSGFTSAPAEATAPPSGHQSLGGQFVQGLVDYPGNMAKDVGSLARLIAAGPLGAAPIAIGMSPEERSHALGGAALALGGPAEKLVGGALEGIPVPALAKRLLAGAGAWAPVGAAQSIAAGRTAPGSVLASSAVAGLSGAVGHGLMGGGAEPASPMMPPAVSNPRLRDLLEGAQGFPKAPPAPEPVAVPHPVGALTVRGKAGPLVTPEPGDWFHGTAATDMNAGNLDAARTKIEGLFGQGVYLTDDPHIAASYARTRAKGGGTPVVYKARLGDMKFVDMEKPATPEVLAAYKDVAEGYPFGGMYQGQPESNAEAFDAIKDKPGVTPQELHRALSEDATDISHNDYLPASEFYDAFGRISDNLRGLGYEGLQHTGGLRVGNKLHKVTILTDPQDMAGLGRKPEVQSFEPVPMGSPYRAVPVYATPKAPPDPFSRLRGLAPPPPPSNVDRFMEEWDAHEPVAEAPTKAPRSAPNLAQSATYPALDELAQYGQGGRQASTLLNDLIEQEQMNLGHANRTLRPGQLPKPESPLAYAVGRAQRGVATDADRALLAANGGQGQKALDALSTYYRDWLARGNEAGHLLIGPNGSRNVPLPQTERPGGYFPRPTVSEAQAQPGMPLRANMAQGLVDDGFAKTPEQASAMIDAHHDLMAGRTGKSTSLAANALIDNGAAQDMAQALAILRGKGKGRASFLGSSAGFARRAVENPFFDRDPTRSVLRYMHESEPTLARTQVLGPNHDAVTQALGGIHDRAQFEQASRLADYIEKGPQKEGPVGQAVDKAGRALSSTVIGPMTAIEHTAQGQNIPLVTGLKSTARGLARAMTPAGRAFAEESGARNPEALAQYQETMGPGSGRVANALVKYSGLKNVMLFWRTVAANAGDAEVQGLAAKLAKNPTDQAARYNLNRLGVNPDAVEAAGGLTDAQRLKAGIRVTNKALFRSHRGDLPMWTGETALARTGNRLQSFLMQQPTLVAKETAGHMGTPGGGRRIARNAALLATLYPATAEVVNDAKALLRGKARTKNPLARYAEDALSAGTTGRVGAFGQAVGVAVKNRDPSPILGALAGQPAERASFTAYALAKLAAGKPLSQYEKQKLYGENVPGVGFMTAPWLYPTANTGTNGLPALLRAHGVPLPVPPRRKRNNP